MIDRRVSSADETLFLVHTFGISRETKLISILFILFLFVRVMNNDSKVRLYCILDYYFFKDM